jgi:hypothetical protein
MLPYSMLDYGSGWSAYAGDDGGEGMMEDTVEANRFAAEHSCLHDNINTNKNPGLFFGDDNDDGPTDCNGVMEDNLQCDNINGMIESLPCQKDDENISRKVVCKKNSFIQQTLIIVKSSRDCYRHWKFVSPKACYQSPHRFMQFDINIGINDMHNAFGKDSMICVSQEGRRRGGGG